jgi:alanyl-tRNA synthetase
MKKLFYQSSYIKSFKSVITNKGLNEKGEHYVVLNDTAFYPEGGGQPSDTGFINEIKVICTKEENNELRHYVNEDLFNINQTVECRIDWNRRYDHMQQHSGQHLLSSVFRNRYKSNTVSFHLGKDSSTIDIEMDSISAGLLKDVENEVTDLIQQNIKITPVFVDEKDLCKYPIIKEVSKSNNIRLVIIENHDYNGCGGTHVYTTSELGAFSILGWEKNKNNYRIEFIFGNRVNKQFRLNHSIIKDLTKRLSSNQQNIVLAVDKLIQRNIELENTIYNLTEEKLTLEIGNLLNLSRVVNDNKLLIKDFENRDFKELIKLAKFITTEDSDINLFFILITDKTIQLIFGRGNNSSINMKDLLNKTLPFINGRGGGNDLFAQGKGDKIISSQELIEKITEIIKY